MAINKRYWILTHAGTLYKIDSPAKSLVDDMLMGKPVTWLDHRTFKQYLDSGKKLAGYIKLSDLRLADDSVSIK